VKRVDILTGDRLSVAERVGRSVGVDNIEAECHPEEKHQIVEGLVKSGRRVMMVGDGINDGPALKMADVGVAMGVTGTDFAQAMSDLVLRDDHPAAMLVAIEQGRTAFANIKKSVRYLVATNLSELAATALAVAAGLPDPFDPLALLWTNIATDIEAGKIPVFDGLAGDYCAVGGRNIEVRILDQVRARFQTNIPSLVLRHGCAGQRRCRENETDRKFAHRLPLFACQHHTGFAFSLL